MNFRCATICTAAAIGGSLCLLGQASPTLANDAVVAVAAVAAFPALAGEEPSFSYVGNKKCKKCHIKQYKSWEKTRMGQAFNILRPGQSAEAKKKFNLDATKDYTGDVTCLKCHTVGFGKPGGYVTPDPNDKKAVRTAKKRLNIGCECCHGPGSEFVKVFKEIQQSKRKYKTEELYAVGLLKVGKSTCLKCHNEESPTISAGYVFDYEKRKAKGIHEHFPLKQRAE